MKTILSRERPRLASVPVESHIDDLLASGLDSDTIMTAGVHSASPREVRAALGFGAGAGLVFPYPELNGSGSYARVKLDKAGDDDKKYRSPKGLPNRLYIPAPARRALTDPSMPLWICEGEKKALKACQEGLICIAVSGVWSWRTKRDPDGQTAPVRDLDYIAWTGRTVYLVFDADPKPGTIANVNRAAEAFAAELRRRGAHVMHVVLPLGEGGQKCGLDDYLITHSVDALCMIEPVAIRPDPPKDVTEVWQEPKPLAMDLLPVPPLTNDMVPTPFRGFVVDIAERMQAAPDGIAAGVVLAAGSVIGRQLAIRPKRHDDWIVVPNTFGGLVGPSGNLKTPTIEAAFKPLARLEAAAHEQYRALGKELAFLALQDTIRQKQLKKRLEEAMADGTATDELKKEFTATEYTALRPRRFIVNDSTVEKLQVILSENRNGVCVLRDELVGLLAMMDREGHEGDRAFYCEAWNGQGASYTTDRIGREQTYIPSACLSVFGGITPGPLANYLREWARDGVRDDGLIQRFQLLVYPDVKANWQNVDRWPDDDAEDRVHRIFDALAGLDITAVGVTAVPGKDELAFLRFTEEAQERFDAWRTTLERRLRRDEDEHPAITAHLSKYRSLMPSLALIFHVIDAVDRGIGGRVSLEAAELAITWCTYLEAHARRVYQCMTDSASLAARMLGHKIAAGKLVSPFTARIVQKKEWAGLTVIDEINEAADILVEHHWLRAQDAPPKPGEGKPRGGRPRSVEYVINPAALVKSVR
jgi:putative DNA primase/helicase